MIAGYDRYVQVARCFRDEDLRADRQPEFTQLDLEMSFVEMQDVMAMIDGLVARLAHEILGLQVSLPLPRMTYDEAMERFGHDAPDLRYGMELVDCSDLAADCQFRVFRSAVEQGGRVRGSTPRERRHATRAKTLICSPNMSSRISVPRGWPGSRWTADGQLTSPIAKNFEAGLLERFAERLQAEPGDFLLLCADQWSVTCRVLNGLRRRLASELELYDPHDDEFLLGGGVSDV